MSITIYATIFALITLVILLGIFWLMAIRRKSGKSDVQQSRVSLVIASFIVPILVCISFVISAFVSQKFFNVTLPVGQRGGGVFVILVTSVLTSVLALIALLPRIKHK